jgi:hypothetical protein
LADLKESSSDGNGTWKYLTAGVLCVAPKSLSGWKSPSEKLNARFKFSKRVSLSISRGEKKN